MWSDQEKRIQKIDRLARSLLIQGLSNDIYSLIDSNKTVKDLWDALARHMLGSEYGKQDTKAAIFDSDKEINANIVFMAQIKKVLSDSEASSSSADENFFECVSLILMSKSSCDSTNVEIKLKRKRYLDTFSSVRRPKNSGVIWKKKGSSNTSNI
nr:hypothetical protein [Tanacetum cinerariifolium]